MVTGILLLIACGIAEILGWQGARLGLIPTQGMHGDEPFLKLFAYFAMMLMCVYGLSSAVVLSVLLTRPNGRRMWAYGIAGFVAGAGLAGLVGAAAWSYVNQSRWAWNLLLYSIWSLPPAGGIVAVSASNRK